MKPHPSLAAVVFLWSCGSGPKPAAPTTPSPEPAAPTAEAEPPQPSKLDAAVAEVKRLTALADQDPLLQAWGGDHGGVPPWDKVKTEMFPKSFEI
ncbi:MAG: hypothetical protein ACREBE_22255, partial [bacterium]